MLSNPDEFLTYYNYKVTHTEGCQMEPARFLYPTIRKNLESAAALFGWEAIEEVVDKSVTNNYMNGRSGKRPVIANLFWLTMPTTVEKVLSGRYDNCRERMEAFAQKCREEAQADQERRIREQEAGRGGLFIYLRQKQARGEALSPLEQELLDNAEKKRHATA